MIREFLSFYKMEHTLSVFIPEMSLHADFPKSRDQMVRECGFTRSQDDETKPLILRLVEKVRIGDFSTNPIHVNHSGKKDSNENTDEFSNSPQQMMPQF